MPAIETNGLTKQFGDVTAVDDVSLTVERGEAFGFLGPNGAGKSTTISMLLGFLRPTAGTATVLGENAISSSSRVRERIGLLPEGYDVYENLTGREHLESAIESKRADDDPDAILDRVGLDHEDAQRPAGDYSKGMQQRLFLGIALVGEPELLVLDEPASGLDPSGIKLLREIVASEVERGATVFFSSHDLDEVERVCDRVGIMRSGELVTTNAVDDLRAELGVGAVVHVTVEELPTELPGQTVNGVSEVTADDRTVHLTCVRPEVKMDALAAVDRVATVTDISIEEPSLETVFERYTGNGSTDGSGGVNPATASATGQSPTETEAGDTTTGADATTEANAQKVVSNGHTPTEGDR